MRPTLKKEIWISLLLLPLCFIAVWLRTGGEWGGRIALVLAGQHSAFSPLAFMLLYFVAFVLFNALLASGAYMARLHRGLKYSFISLLSIMLMLWAIAFAIFIIYALPAPGNDANGKLSTLAITGLLLLYRLIAIIRRPVGAGLLKQEDQ